MMIILRQKCYSNVANNIASKLDRAGIRDYDIGYGIPRDAISVKCDPARPEIYIPEDYDYSQYDIDDFIRSMIPFMRTNTVLDRNILKMTLSGSLTETQLYKLVKFIIEENEYCVLI